MVSQTWNRRRVLASTAIAIGSFTAGCSGDDGSDSNSDGSNGDGGDSSSPTGNSDPDSLDACPPQGARSAAELFPRPDGFTLVASGPVHTTAMAEYEGPNGERYLIEYDVYDSAEEALEEAEEALDFTGATIGYENEDMEVEYRLSGQYQDTTMVIHADADGDTDAMEQLLAAADCFGDDDRVGGSWEE